MAGDSSVVLNPGAGGSSMATYQDAGGLQHQKVVLETETPSGDPAKVNASNPLPAAVAGTVASGATNAGNPVKIGAAYNTAAPTFTTGQLGDVQMDVNGNLKVNIAAGAAAGGTSSTFAASFPATGTAVGASDGTNMRALLVDGGGNLKVNIASGSVAAATDNSTFTAGSTQGLLMVGVADNTATVSAVTQGNDGALKMTLNRQLRTVQDATLSGGVSFYNGIQPATPAVAAVKALAGQIYFIHATNNNATPVYIKLFNVTSGSVTLGTTNADIVLEVPGNTAGAGFVLPIPCGLYLGTAITLATTGAIARNDNTAIVANTVIVTVGYA